MRPETRTRLGDMLLALLSRRGPRNCWTVAEAAGEARPWGMQHLLSRLRGFVVEHLAPPNAITSTPGCDI